MAATDRICWQKYDELTTTPDHIDRFLTAARHGSIFQSPRWCLLMEEKPERYIAIAATRRGQPVFASLIRKTRVPGTSIYSGSVQRGPVFDDIELAIDIWKEYEAQLVRSGLCAIELHPFWERSEAQKLKSFLQSRGYVPSSQNISHTETLTIDLTPSEEDIFYSLKGSRRNLIRKAIKIGIQVRPVQNSEEMARFWLIYHDMCLKKGINFWSRKMFERIRRFSIEFPTESICLLGWLNGDLVGGDISLRHSHIAELTRGAGSIKIVNSIPKTDLILWESILWGKRVGATTYDLGGITPNPERGSPEWGVNRFKMEFTQTQVSLMEPMEKIFNESLYGIFSSLKRIKKALLRHLPLRLPA
jgi:lipid II:glycine glycyltransferase (peptidoglycan interpeptide bridge formation enzyme)